VEEAEEEGAVWKTCGLHVVLLLLLVRLSLVRACGHSLGCSRRLVVCRCAARGHAGKTVLSLPVVGAIGRTVATHQNAAIGERTKVRVRER